MESLASGVESEPVRARNDKMKGIDEWVHGAGKKKKRMSKRDRKKSSTIRSQVCWKNIRDYFVLNIQNYFPVLDKLQLFRFLTDIQYFVASRWRRRTKNNIVKS